MTIHSHATRNRLPDHANAARALQRPAGVRSAPDPVLEDCLLGATALCAEIAAEDLATLARAGEFSVSWASEMKRTGGKGGFLHKTTVLRLIDAESECEGAENRAQGRLARTRDLEELERATVAEAAVQEELAAVIRELRRRRLDPFEGRGN